MFAQPNHFNSSTSRNMFKLLASLDSQSIDQIVEFENIYITESRVEKNQ